MATFLECIVDICLPIAGRWIVIQIASLFGTDLNTSTLLWFFTLVLCAFIAENFTFHPKKKWIPRERKSEEKDDSESSEENDDSESSKDTKKEPILQNVEL